MEEISIADRIGAIENKMALVELVDTFSLLQEAKPLLKQTAWTVPEIAYALGFNEVTHFNNFFKKNMSLSPLRFRNV